MLLINEEFSKFFDGKSINIILLLKLINIITFGKDFCKFYILQKEEKNKLISKLIKSGSNIKQIFYNI